MKVKIEQSTAKNPNPILSVEKDGTVLYSNEIGESLLHEWRVEIGGKLPQTFRDLVQRAVSLNRLEKLEVKVGTRAYLIVFDPVLDEKHVNISGFEISDKNEFEEKLQESERRYHLLFDNMLDGFAYCKLCYDEYGHPVDFIYLDTNRAFEQLTGLKKVNGKRATEVIPGIKESHPELLDTYSRVALTGKPEKFEIEFKPLGIWLSISVYSTEREHFVAVFDNITERKRAEKALRESEEKYRIVAENTYDWEFLLSLDGHFLYVSPSCERVTGYTAWEFMDNPDLLHEIMHPDDRQAFLQHQHDMPSSRHGNIEFRIITKDGEIRWIHHLCQSLYDDKGCYAGSRGSNRDITERKRAEETLAFERSQLLSIFEGIDDVVYVTDPCTYEVLYANKAMKEKFGGELVGGICYREFQERDSPCDFCTNPIILKERDKPYQWEYYNPTVDRFFMIMDRIIKWPDGRDVRFEIAKDITESKRVEEALRESEEKYRNLIETANEGIWVFNSVSETTYVNEKMAQMLGYSREEMVGSFIWDYANEEDKGIFQVYLEKRKQGIDEIYELKLMRKEGSYIWLLVSAKAFFDKDGKFAGSLGMFTDITDRKHAEEALKKAHDSLGEKVKERTEELEKAYKSLKESEKGLAEAQKMAHIGNWDNNLVIGKLHWSEEMYHIFGLSFQEPMTYDKFLNYVHPDDRDYVYNSTKDAFNGNVYTTEYRIVRPDGEERIVHSEREVFFDENNNPVRMTGTVQDITERKKAEEDLAKMEKIRIKEIHHRIKNNLQVISSLLDLQVGKFSHLEVCKVPEVIEAFKESQNRIISMALIHEELYKGNNLDTLDFAAYLKKLTENLCRLYDPENKDINLNLDFEQVYLSMDTAIPLGIIVNELISNSFKHAFPTGRKGEIAVKLSRTENLATKNEISGLDKDFKEKNSFGYVLKVSDNGKGIPQEIDLENVDSLGLQLVNILVKQLEGVLEIKSDTGTEFTIWFND